MNSLDQLNPMQKKAVACTEGPLLVLAGAGSGKTRVLAHRIAYLIEEKKVKPWNILAITFTNKAAGEMRDRVDQQVSSGAESIWVSTFHAACARILRRHIEYLGYTTHFTIYDPDDQKSLLKQVYKTLDIDNRLYRERTVLGRISSAKDKLITPDECIRDAGENYHERRIAEIYAEYQKRLKESDALDFDDLLMKTVELFRTQPEVLDYYQERFRYIMVDEYQDTNKAQFELVRLLADKHKNICVVGDDDQSIYRFRGADIGNILNFEEAFPGAKVVKLEQNYRSTQTILDAANAVISNNADRKEKSLWTANGTGGKIIYKQFDQAYEEADYIIRDILNRGYPYEDCAVLYRTNAQSRLLEEKCISCNVPYRLVGGVNFYQRKEVKDVLAYLKTIANGRDDVAAARIINVPRRGIGAASLGKVTVFASANGYTLYDAMARAREIPGLGKAAEKIGRFTDLIETFRARVRRSEEAAARRQAGDGEEQDADLSVFYRDIRILEAADGGSGVDGRMSAGRGGPAADGGEEPAERDGSLSVSEDNGILAGGSIGVAAVKDGNGSAEVMQTSAGGDSGADAGIAGAAEADPQASAGRNSSAYVGAPEADMQAPEGRNRGVGAIMQASAHRNRGAMADTQASVSRNRGADAGIAGAAGAVGASDTSAGYGIRQLIEDILEETGYRDELREADTEESESRLENIEELARKAWDYEREAVHPTLDGFLEEVALVADVDELDQSENRVTLMTLHSAKGLEFENVYLSGLEDGVFPSYMSATSENPSDLEEERRLCYVGITRAKRHLTLTGARMRMVNGQVRPSLPSRFLDEIPEELIQSGRPGTGGGYGFYDRTSWESLEDGSRNRSGKNRPERERRFYGDGGEDGYTRETGFGDGPGVDFDEVPVRFLDENPEEPGLPWDGTRSDDFRGDSSDTGCRDPIGGAASGSRLSGGAAFTSKLSDKVSSGGAAFTSKLSDKVSSGGAAFASKLSDGVSSGGAVSGIPRAGLSPRTARRDKPAGTSRFAPDSRPDFGRAFTVQKSKPAYKIGDRVKHVKFGEGTVIGIEERPKDYMVAVEFDSVGVRRLFASFLKSQEVE